MVCNPAPGFFFPVAVDERPHELRTPNQSFSLYKYPKFDWADQLNKFWGILTWYRIFYLGMRYGFWLYIIWGLVNMFPLSVNDPESNFPSNAKLDFLRSIDILKWQPNENQRDTLVIIIHTKWWGKLEMLGLLCYTSF